MRLRRPLATSTVAALTLVLLWPLAPSSADQAEAAPTPVASPTRGGPAAGTSRRVPTPTLTARATLSADYLAPGPDSGAEATPKNGRKGPFDGQVIPGFSGVIANGDGTYWAMPDNGFGAKDNSADFLLRLYLVKPAWETAAGGRGKIKIIRYLSLRDPDSKINFPLVNGTPAGGC